ncbi:hypothetical protein ABT154_21345 [Streptomyces sp. NPDC001728]|uniref:hypothetical protein n=1 Tax=Streptomyces sp. NPDC001728 TaxID=3154396 RepID=UPI00333190F7
MRRHTAVAATLLLALVGCSGQEASTTPTPAVATTEPGVFPAEQRQVCVDAWAVTIGNRPDDFNPETDTDPTPEACTGIPESDWVDAYMDGLFQSNRAARDAAQERSDAEASKDAQNP